MKHLAAYALCAFAIISLAAGCARSPSAIKPSAQTASFSPEGRWRSRKLGVMTVHMQPDGSLLVVDQHRGKHPFPRVGPDRWEAQVSREVKGSFHREGDQLVFRGEPTPEASKPIAQKNGLTIVHSARPIEDRMTRMPETGPGNKAPN
jgi:hypothetical protein